MNGQHARFGFIGLEPGVRSRHMWVLLIAYTPLGVLNGLGVVSGAALVGRLPKVFADLGYDEFTAGQYTLFVVAGLCLVSACVVGFGLRPGAAVGNPRIALAYAFVARGDMVVVGTFLVLWGKVAAMEGGMTAADALSAGRIPFIVAQSSALLWAIAAIFILDRFHRVTGLMVCLGIATAAYLGLAFVEDPLAPANLPFFVMLGIGQISAFSLVGLMNGMVFLAAIAVRLRAPEPVPMALPAGRPAGL